MKSPEEILRDYAVKTAADMGEDFAAAVRAMRDELGEVERETGIPAFEIAAWCRDNGA